MTYWYKEQFSIGYMVDGKNVAFEPLAGNQGVLALNPEVDTGGRILAALEAIKGTLGVVKINAEDYEAKKKAYPWKGSERGSEGRLRTAPSRLNPLQPTSTVQGADPVAVEPPIAPTPPVEERPKHPTDPMLEQLFKPAVRKVGRPRKEDSITA